MNARRWLAVQVDGLWQIWDSWYGYLQIAYRTRDAAEHRIERIRERWAQRGVAA